jgi:hypothetical protein
LNPALFLFFVLRASHFHHSPHTLTLKLSYLANFSL